MFDINKIMCEKTNMDMGVNSNYKILGLFNKIDALETITFYEVLFKLRSRNVISSSQFRSTRGQLKYNKREIYRFIIRMLLEKYKETSLLDNKLKEISSNNSLIMVNKQTGELYKIDKCSKINIQLGE